MSNPLARVKRAAAAKRRTDENYRATIVDAVTELEQAGERSAFAIVAKAAGISRQAVRQLVDRAR